MRKYFFKENCTTCRRKRRKNHSKKYFFNVVHIRSTLKVVFCLRINNLNVYKFNQSKIFSKSVQYQVEIRIYMNNTRQVSPPKPIFMLNLIQKLKTNKLIIFWFSINFLKTNKHWASILINYQILMNYCLSIHPYHKSIIIHQFSSPANL